MIHSNSHTIEWITEKSRENRNTDKILIEKVIKALSLSEQLKQTNIDFIFKGGTALLLLLPEPKRLSIDIDIILQKKQIDINFIFDKIIEQSNFIKFEEQTREVDSKIEKSHYKFYYKPVTDTRGVEEYILLDILYESNPYFITQETEINSSFLDIINPLISFKAPTLEEILGDKLTAFAPNTTGVPYFKNNNSMSMEIIKQLYDIGCLFDVVNDFSIVKQTFKKIAQNEMSYRNINITDKSFIDVLEDICQTALCLTTRGNDGIGNFKELQKGIQKVSSFIFSESYFIQKAIIHASKAAYLSSLIKSDSKQIIRFNNPDESTNLIIEQPFNTKLNKLKRTNPEAFFYWYQACINKSNL